MPIKTRDPNSGAIIYTSTPEEIETSNYKRDIKKMKKQIVELEEKIQKLFDLYTQIDKTR